MGKNGNDDYVPRRFRKFSNDRPRFIETESGDRTESKKTGKGCLLLVLGMVLAVVSCSVLISSGSESESGSKYQGSRGAAEVACERAIENSYGRDAKVSEYFSVIEDAPGNFELRGQITTKTAGSKFLCTVKNARERATDATATIELYG